MNSKSFTIGSRIYFMPADTFVLNPKLAPTRQAVMLQFRHPVKGLPSNHFLLFVDADEDPVHIGLRTIATMFGLGPETSAEVVYTEALRREILSSPTSLTSPIADAWREANALGAFWPSEGLPSEGNWFTYVDRGEVQDA